MLSLDMAESKTVKLLVKRQDTPEGHSYWQEFEIPYEAQMNVTTCLQSIAAVGATADGHKTPPVAYDANCLEEVCGSCTMLINGRVRQACSALVDNLVAEEGEVIRLEPMTKFPVIRDLFVDRRRMFEALKRVKAWVPVDGYVDDTAPPTMSPKVQDQGYPLQRCMTCGCCVEACPQVNDHTQFIGAAAIGQAMIYQKHAIGQNLADERLEALMETGGIAECGNAQNCVKVCPKSVPLTEAIARANRALTVYAVRRWFER
jgi:succinate dehydrogenase / fumarate reductase, iron-sulfur subunit